MKLFGQGWGHPEFARCDVPIGVPCFACGKVFVANDLGVIMPFLRDDHVSMAAYHRACLVAQLGLDAQDRA